MNCVENFENLIEYFEEKYKNRYFNEIVFNDVLLDVKFLKFLDLLLKKTNPDITLDLSALNLLFTKETPKNYGDLPTPRSNYLSTLGQKLHPNHVFHIVLKKNHDDIESYYIINVDGQNIYLIDQNYNKNQIDSLIDKNYNEKKYDRVQRWITTKFRGITYIDQKIYI